MAMSTSASAEPASKYNVSRHELQLMSQVEADALAAVRLDAPAGAFAGSAAPVYVTVTDQRNTKQLEAIYPGIHVGKPGLDVAEDAWLDLFGSAAEARTARVAVTAVDGGSCGRLRTILRSAHQFGTASV
jgi:hypothetical protein